MSAFKIGESVRCIDPGANTHITRGKVYTVISTHPHVGGVHVLLADGSVRMLSDNMDFATLCRLAVRDDGQPVGEF